MAKGTHALIYQKSIESAGLVLAECWKVYNSKDPQINYFHRIAALKLALQANSEIMNFTMNGSTVLSVSRITERANKLGLLNDNEKEPLTETEQINNYINSNNNNNNPSNA